MLTLIITFLKAHWQTSLIATAILAVLTALSVQHLEIRHLKGELAACHAEGVTLEDSNERLIMSVNEQDEAIAGLKARGLANKNAGAKALAAAKLRAGRYAQAARVIETATPSADECADMRRLVKEAAAKD